MPCCARVPEARGRSGRRVAHAAIFLVALVGMQAAGASRPGFSIEHASTSLRDGVYYVDADVDLNLSSESKEALENGVPLTIRYDMQVLRTRPWLWDPMVAALEARYTLELHALSKQYVVRNLNLGTTQSYASLASARAALGRLKDFPLVDANLLDQQADYHWRIRARLDIEALPAPLRPLAYLSALWRHDSDWYEWPLTP